MIYSIKQFLIAIQRYKNFLSSEFQFKLNKHLILIFFSTLIQSISITAIIPFVATFFNPEMILNNKVLTLFIKFENYNIHYFQLFITVCFLIILVISFFVSYFSELKSIELSFQIENQIKERVYRSKLFQSYINQINTSSDKIISLILQKSNLISNMINSFFNFISSTFLILLLIILITLYNYKVLLFILPSILLIYFFIFKKNVSNLKKSSSKLSANQDKIIQNLQNTLGFLNEIKLYSLEKKFLSDFVKANQNISNSLIYNKKIVEIPRIKIEYFLVIFLVAFLYFLNLLIPLNKMIPFIGFVGYSFQKLFPAINKFYSSISSFDGERKSILDIIQNLNILSKQVENSNIIKNKITFNDEINLKNLDFSYKNNKYQLLKKINLKIKRNSKLAIIGKTGIGKSTLLSIITGMIIPNKGNVFIDKNKLDSSNLESWQNQVSIVSQNIYLKDDTVLNNITLGKKIKNKQYSINKILKICQINQFYKNNKLFKFNKVGENGKKLSGGQKQRIAIARALYRNPKVLIMDEGTNQLDKLTQSRIINNLLKIKNVTLIFITHDKSILNKFDKVFDLEKNKIIN